MISDDRRISDSLVLCLFKLQIHTVNEVNAGSIVIIIFLHIHAFT